jgi:hypothetical protein
MADSKPVQLDAHGLMVAASAYRVKYRKVDTDNKIVRNYVRIDGLGDRKKNRGGVYPAGVRRLYHACIAMEQCPLREAIRSRGEDVVNATEYNVDDSNKDELLISCFRVPYDDVRFMLLSHNHMMLIMRAFTTQAKWDIPACEDKNITFCDTDGRDSNRGSFLENGCRGTQRSINHQPSDEAAAPIGDANDRTYRNRGFERRNHRAAGQRRDNS